MNSFEFSIFDILGGILIGLPILFYTVCSLFLLVNWGVAVVWDWLDDGDTEVKNYIEEWGIFERDMGYRRYGEKYLAIDYLGFRDKRGEFWHNEEFAICEGFTSEEKVQKYVKGKKVKYFYTSETVCSIVLGLGLCFLPIITMSTFFTMYVFRFARRVHKKLEKKNET